MAALLLWPLPWTPAGRTWGSSELAAQPAAQTESADRLQIERLGGLANAGGQGSRLKARGEVAQSDLSAADRQAVENLFRAGSRADPGPGGDRPRYQIRRQTPSGQQAIVVPEDAVPEALKKSVKDVIE